MMNLDPNFGYVVLSVVAVGLHYASTMRYVMKARRKYKIEYPDMGCGRYAARLEKDQWVDFNNAQRVHYNYLEELPSVYAMIFVSGLLKPRATAWLTAVYIIGRQIYATGYMSYGPKGRIPGVLVHHAGFFGMIALAIHNGLQIAQILQ